MIPHIQRNSLASNALMRNESSADNRQASLSHANAAPRSQSSPALSPNQTAETQSSDAAVQRRGPTGNLLHNGLVVQLAEANEDFPQRTSGVLTEEYTKLDCDPPYSHHAEPDP